MLPWMIEGRHALHVSSSTLRACTTFLRSTSAISLANVTFSVNTWGSVIEGLGIISFRIFNLKAGMY